MSKFKSLFLVITIIILSGCTFLQDVSNKSAERAANAIVEYCAQITPELREEFRRNINSKLQNGASVKVVCPNDIKAE